MGLYWLGCFTSHLVLLPDKSNTGFKQTHQPYSVTRMKRHQVSRGMKRVIGIGFDCALTFTTLKGQGQDNAWLNSLYQNLNDVRP